MKTLQVNLQVQADIAAAQRNIQSLAQLLNQIGSKPIAVDSGPLREAQKAAQQLQVHLQNAVNVNTGKLNLNALNSSLKQSGTNLNQLAMNLQNAGTTGQQAFLKLAQAVSSAEVPMYRMNSHLRKIGVTLLNTIKWQVASNLIHGVQGAFQGVIIHAKELNRALNDIQIVTGYTTNQMAELTESAKRAAKELNATTVEYSKAALIFYQQGLSGDAVEERTNTVIKLAHVTGQTAETVSSQMTAIWNNFDDGSHNLEYFADVITKLGAATASSSAEISEGLQKFAAVADTVGLSYERAAASLATVVAETRQSPEVVGTAFKTILARIEGLNLGETLGDGVNLNKYSEALQKVGINILDTKGELLEMDDILDKLGKQWNLLGDQTKVALAQTVAGVRQYSQFIAWMDNYDKVLDNQKLAEKSTGTLQKQAEIWSDSYEAAAKRVEQTKTELYEKIFDDKALIRLEDSFGKILKGIGVIMESAGGFVPLILQITASLSGTLIPMLFNSFRRISNHISILSGHARASMEATQSSFNSMLENMLLKENGWSETTKKQIELTLRLSQAKQELAIASKNMSEKYKQEAASQMQVYEAQVSNIQKILEEKQALEDDIAKIKEKIQVENSREIGKAAGMKSFNENHKEDLKSEERESIEKQAKTTTIHTTNKAIEEYMKNNSNDYNAVANDLTKQQTQLQGMVNNQERFEEILQKKQQELDILREQGAAEEDIVNKEKEIAEFQDRIIKTKGFVQQAENNVNQLTERKKELYQGIVENADEELKKLLLVQEAQIEINKAKQDSNNAVIGTVEGFSSYESSGATGQAAQLTDQMRNAVSQTMNATDVDGELKLETSIANMEKLCAEFSKYKILLKDSKQYQDNFKKSVDKIKTSSPYQNLQKQLNNYEQQLKQLPKINKNSTEEQKRQYNTLKQNIDAVKKEMDKQLIPTANNMKNKLLDLAKQAGLTGNKFNDFKKEVSDLAAAGNIDELKQKFQNFDVAVNNTQTEIFDLVNSMRTQFEELHIPTEVFNSFIDKLVQMNLLTDEEAKKLKGLPDNFKPPVDKVTKFANSLGKATSIVGTLSMALSGIKSVAQIWTDDDADTFEKISTTLMSMTMIIPALTQAMQLGAFVQELFTKATKKGTAATEQHAQATREDTIETQLNTAADTAEAGAEATKDAVKKHGYVGAAIGLAAAGAIVAGMIALQVASNNTAKESAELTQIQQENAEQTKQQTQNVIELANKWQEEANKMDVLIKKYKELNNEQKDTLQVQKDILEQAPNLIKAYKDINEKLKNSGGPDLTNQINQLEIAVAGGDSKLALQLSKEIENVISTATVDGIKKGTSVASGELNVSIDKSNYGQDADKLKKEFSYFAAVATQSKDSDYGKVAAYYADMFNKANAGEQIFIDFDDQGKRDSNTVAIQEKIAKIIQDKDLKIDYYINPEKEDDGWSNNITFGIDNTDPERKLQQIKDLKMIYETIINDDELGEIASTNPMIAELKDFFDQNQEAIAGLEEYVMNEQKYKIEGIIQSEKIDITEIGNYSEYDEKVVKPLREKLAEEKGKTWSELSEAEQENINLQIKAWAEGKDVLKESLQISDKFAYIEQQYGKSVKENAQAWYNSLSDEDKKYFLQMDFSQAATDKNFQIELNRVKEKAKQETISVNLTAVSDAKKSLKENDMSADDWNKIANLDWDEIYKQTGIKYIDFLHMAYNEQKMFFDQIEEDWGTELPQSIQKGIDDAQNIIDSMNQKTGKKIDSSEYEAAVKKMESLNYEDSTTGKTISGVEAYKAIQQQISNLKNKQEENKTKGIFQSFSENMDIQDSINGLQDTLNQYSDAYGEYKEALNKYSNITMAEMNEYIQAEQTIKDGAEKLAVSIRSTLMNVNSLEELNQKILELQNSGFDIEKDYYSSLASSLIMLGNKYDNCTEEITKFQQALVGGSEEVLKEAEAVLRVAISVGEMSEALNLENKNVEEQAKELISVNGLLKENYSVAAKVAILNQSMNKGLKELVDNWDEYKKTLTSAQKGTQAYAETALNTKKALAQMLGLLSTDYIPEDFLDLPETMTLIDQAVQGDINSINKLGLSMAEATIKALEWKEGMEASTHNEDGFLEMDSRHLRLEEFEDWKTTILTGINTLTEGIQNGTIQAGQDITELLGGTKGSWVKALNEMAFATNMTVDEMKSLLNEMGVDAEVVVKEKETEQTVPEYATIETEMSPEEVENVTGEKINPNAKYKPSGRKSYTTQIGSKKVKGSVQVAAINTGDNVGKNVPKIKYAGRDNPSSAALTKSDSSSSSSSSKKTTSAASHTHEVHRYDNEKNAVEGLKKQYEYLNKAKDKAFGASRIQAMEAELKKLKELKKASGDYLDAIVGKGNASKVAEALYTGKNIGSMISGGQLGGTVKSDYNSLFNGLSASGKGVEYTAKDADGNQRLVSSNYSLGEFNRLFGTNLSFSLDSYGNLYNKDAILNLLNNLQNKEASAYSSVADPSASSTTEYNYRIAFLKEVKERVEQFGTTLNDLSTQSDQYLEYISQIQEKNAELISEKLNNGITLSNHTLTRLERAIKVLGNNIYKSTEDMAKWFDIKTRQNSAEYEKQHKLNEDAFEKIRKGVELYEKNPLDENAITPAKAAEMLEAIENSEAELYEKQQQDIADVGEFLTQALEQWKTNIQNVTSSIDFNIEKLSHLQKVFELLGKTADFENLGIILEEQAAAAKIDYEQARDTANKAKIPYLEAKSALSKMQEGTEDYNFFYEHTYLPLAQTYEQYEKDAEAKYEEFLSKAALVHENNRNKIYQQYEQTLTGQYGSFDNLDKSMERKKSLTDEYLTKTNQIYETNKMLRSLQQDIDKTDSSIAKKELNDFAKKITALQNIEKLTKNDLELAKAKYEILKAEIALREAQIAKSTVRLRRDNEGNYGYIYTADQDKVADAEQNLADKQNNYYNKLIEQENDYIEKDISLWSEYQEEKKALEDAFYVAGTINKQQFLLGMEELDAYFREKESLYHEEANERGTLLDEVAVEQRSEAWSSMYEDIALKQSLFNDTTTGAAQVLNQKLQQEMNDWNSFREEEQQKAEIDNEHLKETVHDVTREVENLGSQIVKKGGLADQFKNLSGTTEDLTKKFMNQYTQLSNNADIYSTFADKVGIAVDQMRNLTTAQIEYNRAVANQPSTNYGNGSAGKYGAVAAAAAGVIASTAGSIIGTSTPETYNDDGKWYKDSRFHWRILRSSKDKTKTKESNKAYHKWGSAILHRISGGGSVYYTQTCTECGAVRGTDAMAPKRELVDSDFVSVQLYKSGGYTGKWTSGKTGMYTGSWNGPDLEENGKLAFLHQKELVLNADDTENILDAVKLIRQISQTIDLQAMAYNNSAFGLAAAHLASNNQTLQQEVTIHAEFPNATDHNEIEEAFNNLVNRASQYANRY